MRIFNRYTSARSLTAFGVETGIIAVAILLATNSGGQSQPIASQIGRVVLATTVCTLTLYYNQMYDFTIVQSIRQVAIRVAIGVGMASIALGVMALVVPGSLARGAAYLIAFGAVIVTVPMCRAAFDRIARDPHLEQSVLILGTGPMAQTVARQIAEQHDFPYRVAGFVNDRHDLTPTEGTLGHAGDLSRIIAAHHIDLVVVGTSERRGTLPIADLLQAKLAGVRVEDAATTYEQMTGKILIDDLKPSWLIFSDGFRPARVTRVLKRGADLMLGGVGLVLAAPLMLLTALVVRLESPGPVLYRQERVGERGRTFTLLKFRSMRADAENGTPVWAQAIDHRVTRVGRFIRLTRLDELPQLWNVLRGDMSFVGPRPERPFFVEQLTARIPFYGERHAVRPGLTGWAQVKYRYGSSFEDAAEKLRYDLYYIKHLSVLFDMTIVLDTVKVIVCRMGAR